VATEEEDLLTPQEEVRPRTTGLYCFMSAVRVCGPDCMGYVTHPRSSPIGELGTQGVHCILLSTAERLGRGVLALASMQAATVTKQRNKDADRAREEQFAAATPNPAASPFGKKNL
jgi:hypothetical protein